MNVETRPHKKIPLISHSLEWQNVKNVSAHLPAIKDILSPEHTKEFIFSAADLTVDLSRNSIDQTILRELIKLAKRASLPQEIHNMFAGLPINTTEQRAVLHVALRANKDEIIETSGKNVVPEVHKVLNQMEIFTNQIHSGEWKGYSGKSIKKIVALGIGGSSLGPEMACEALKDYKQPHIEVVFVSNIDPTAITDVLQDSNPEETLFIIASKTFTTDEVLSNAIVAKKWLTAYFGNENAVARHFVAASTNKKAAEEFGVNPQNIFEFWDWVGGRYSMCSAIGLPIMLSIGPKNFKEMLSGFHAIDEHFRTTSIDKNVPILMALLQVMNVNFMGRPDLAIVPYSDRLKKMPAYLQQLIMESLGKSVNKHGEVVDYETGATIMGGSGTDVQHSFFESFHQGRLTPVTFIGFVENASIAPQAIMLQPMLLDQHKKLMANMNAQANTLAYGESENVITQQGSAKALVSHKVLPGNRPSIIIEAQKLTPKTLGEIVGLFEHMTFSWGTILGINPFDQFGVEAGKRKAREIYLANTHIANA